MLILIAVELILHVFLFSTAVFSAPVRENLTKPNTCLRLRRGRTRVLSLLALAVAVLVRRIVCVGRKATKRAWQQLEAIVLTYACRYSEKPYISEVLMTIAVAVVCSTYRRAGFGVSAAPAIEL